MVFKSRVTSHNNDMSSPLEKGRAKGAGWICPAGASFYVADNVLLAGIVSHVWHEILRLSPHLFWLRLFSHRAFSSVQDDDTGERKGFHLGDTLRVLELSVLYTIRVGPWRRAAPKAQDRVPRRGTTLRSGMKNDMRRSVFLACHEGRSRGILLADR